MGLLSRATTGSNAEFIREYLLILLTIQKSELNSFLYRSLLTVPRVLLATIRDNGLCPCPRCLMPKTHLDRTGWVHDLNFRTNNVRQYLHAKVQAAQSFIYQLGHAVAGARVDGLLKLTSSVPTLVSKLLFQHKSTWLDQPYSRTPFANSLDSWGRNLMFPR